MLTRGPLCARDVPCIMSLIPHDNHSTAEETEAHGASVISPGAHSKWQIEDVHWYWLSKRGPQIWIQFPESPLTSQGRSRFPSSTVFASI